MLPFLIATIPDWLLQMQSKTCLKHFHVEQTKLVVACSSLLRLSLSARAITSLDQITTQSNSVCFFSFQTFAKLQEIMAGLQCRKLL